MKKRGTILPFDIAPTEAALTAHGGLVLPYETAEALKLPKVIDRELPRPGSGRGYKSSEFVIPMILMLHGGGKKLDDLREIEAEVNLRDLLGVKELPASCTVGDWLRRMGQNGEGMLGLERVNEHMVREGLKRDRRRCIRWTWTPWSSNQRKRKPSGHTRKRKDISRSWDSCLNSAW